MCVCFFSCSPSITFNSQIWYKEMSEIETFMSLHAHTRTRTYVSLPERWMNNIEQDVATLRDSSETNEIAADTYLDQKMHSMCVLSKHHTTFESIRL